MPGLSTDGVVTWEYINLDESNFFYQEIFDRSVYFRHGIDIPENGVVIDAGANIGLFSLCCSTKLKNLRIIAIEPLPPVFKVLQRNLKGICAAAMAICVGLGDENDSTKKFYYFENFPRESTANLSERNAQLETCIKELKTLKSTEGSEELSKLRLPVAAYEHLAMMYAGEESNTSDFENNKEPEDYLCPITTLESIILSEDISVVHLLKVGRDLDSVARNNLVATTFIYGQVDVEGDELLVLRGIGSVWPRVKQIVVGNNVMKSATIYAFPACTTQMLYITAPHQPHNISISFVSDSL